MTPAQVYYAAGVFTHRQQTGAGEKLSNPAELFSLAASQFA